VAKSSNNVILLSVEKDKCQKLREDSVLRYCLRMRILQDVSPSEILQDSSLSVGLFGSTPTMIFYVPDPTVLSQSKE
jgi:hypothetical protein